jgi:hypothetical protein
MSNQVSKTQNRPARIAVVAFAASLLCTAPACKRGADKLAGAPGSYDGFVVSKASGLSSQVFVSGTVARPSTMALTLAVKSDDGATSYSFSVAVVSEKEIKVTEPTVFPTAVTLNEESDDCFHTAAGAPSTVRVCYDGNEIAIDDTSGPNETLFILDKHDKSDSPVQETPAAYTVQQLLERGKTLSFASEEQFETAEAARLASENAHLQLLPHFSYNDIMSLVSFSWTTLLHLVGDVAPFLLPQNWSAAAAAKNTASADYYAYLTMKGDSGEIAEGLAYAVLRDSETLTLLGGYNSQYEYFRDTILAEEKMGVVLPHSSDGLTQVVNSLNETEILLRQTIATETHELAQAVGFVNPDAVSSVTAPDVVAVETPRTVVVGDAQKIAIDRSPELKGIDAQVAAAKDNALTQDLFWTDPSGGGQGLGAGVPVFLKAGYVKVAEIVTQRQQLQATVLQKVEDAIIAMSTAAQTYQIAKSNFGTQTDNVNGLEAMLKMGISVSPTQIQQALQNEVSSTTQLLSSKYEYAVAQGTLNRLLFEGDYLDILSMITSGQPLPKP